MGYREIIDACLKQPGYRAVVISPTYDRSYWKMRETVELLNRGGYAFKHKPAARVVEFVNGSRLQFATTVDAESRRLDGYVIHGAHYSGEISERARELVNCRVNRHDPVYNYKGYEAELQHSRFFFSDTSKLELKIYDKYYGSGRYANPTVSGMIPFNEEEKVIPTPKTHRFYVGSPIAYKGARDWAKKSLAEAVEHAKQRVEETGEEQFIVKVIKVVRRKAPPIVVEDVK